MSFIYDPITNTKVPVVVKSEASGKTNGKTSLNTSEIKKPALEIHEPLRCALTGKNPPPCTCGS